jgi:hypothetical protein
MTSSPLMKPAEVAALFRVNQLHVVPGTSETFTARVLKYTPIGGEDDCWPWVGALDGKGYGAIGKGARGAGIMRAHTAMWWLVNGQPPADLVYDHLCRNRACVNPRHGEYVTFAENVRRGGLPGRSAPTADTRWTACPGHEAVRSSGTARRALAPKPPPTTTERRSRDLLTYEARRSRRTLQRQREDCDPVGGDREDLVHPDARRAPPVRPGDDGTVREVRVRPGPTRCGMTATSIDRERAFYRGVVWILMLAFSVTFYGLVIAALRAAYS